jgi:hypothetical protein
MVGTQPTGAVPGVVISSQISEGLTVKANGRRARLAVIDDEGHILASGDQVAREAEAVAINAYRNFLEGEMRLVVSSKPIPFVMPPEERGES